VQSANDDHDSEHDQHGTSGEEEDVVPPLPDPSPIKATARPIRRTRSIASAAASDTGDDEGGTSRRRSSRLTTAGSSSNLSPEKAGAEVITAPKSVKKSRSSTTKTSKRK
jgi:hypothetical protein